MSNQDQELAASGELMDSKRVRNLTTPAQEEYERRVAKFTKDLMDIKSEMDASVAHLEDIKDDPNSLKSVQEFVMACAKTYEQLSSKFTTYLSDIRTYDSELERSSHGLIKETVKCKASLIVGRIDSLLKPSLRPKSRHSSSSLSSSKFSENFVERKEAELRAAIVKRKYLEEEANIILQKADLETRLNAIKVEQEIETKQAEVSALKQHAGQFEFPEEDPILRTQAYVESLTKERPTVPQYESYLNPSWHTTEPLTRHSEKLNPATSTQIGPRRLQFNNSKTQQDGNIPRAVTEESLPDLPYVSSSPVLNPAAVPYRPLYCETSPPVDNNNNASQPVADLTKFLMKKDLILARISKYDDNPSLFYTWKLTFKNVVEELGVTPMEELDMLIRYLGVESARQALVIRKCNADNPTTALRLVWERLEERFGAPELIESSLRRQISLFPKINYHDLQKLYNLVDLVEEIASVKRQPQYASLFGYFDSPTGINPLVVKLPTALQEKWTVEATKYKKRAAAVYPPFTFFVGFLKDLARMKNDPSFNYSGDSDKTVVHHTRNARNPAVVSVRKTETSVNRDPSEASDLPRCPVHHTRHSLNECNSFRSRPIEDRKQFIMKQGLCFKCCGAKKHRAKDCTYHVKCIVCSGPHPGALHEDTRHQEKIGKSTHEGEERTERVSSSCTQICGTTHGTSRSCAKIVPARIYHEDSKHHSRTVYAIIDDQSNHSLASSAFFDAFDQNTPTHQYTLVSCSGSVTTSGRRASGFKIESWDGSCSLALPTLIECTEFPNNREEIPDRCVAENFTYLTDIKDHIPELMEDVQIEILIGRDLIDAHIVQDQRKGTSGMPYAQKLPLGWVVIGMVCLSALHIPDKITVNKTHILGNGRPSILQPCENKLHVKDNIFVKTEHDEKVAPSIEDNVFLDLMDENSVGIQMVIGKHLYHSDPRGSLYQTTEYRLLIEHCPLTAV
ncbi:uncharacterized protein LOC144624026 [Crassostrea virginica]